MKGLYPELTTRISIINETMCNRAVLESMQYAYITM
jgi:hypothetical protein